MNEVLLSCPFCGSRAVNIFRTNPNACWVECDSCGAKAESAPTRAEAIANWNRTEPRFTAEVVVLDDDQEYWESVKRIKQGAA